MSEIDLTKDKVFGYNAWFKSSEYDQWTEGFLVEINHRNDNPYYDTVNETYWKYCTLTDPYAERPMTRDEILQVLVTPYTVVRGDSGAWRHTLYFPIGHIKDEPEKYEYTTLKDGVFGEPKRFVVKGE